MIWREATRDDVPAVVALLADDMLGRTRELAGIERYLAAFDAMQAEAGNRLYVAEENDEIIACYQLILMSGLSLSASRRAEMEGVRVAPAHRNRGLGAALMQDAETRARAAGCALIQLTTNAQRTDAHRFYQRLGFTPSHIGFKKPL